MLKAIRFPREMPAPHSYYAGVESAARPVARNAVVFMRNDRVSLQQKHFANRSHHRHVLMLVLDTPGSVIVDGAEIPLGKHDALLVLPFQFHHYINLASDRLRWLFVTFDLAEGSAPLDGLGQCVLPQDVESLALWSHLAALWQTPPGPARAELLPVLDRLLLRLGVQAHSESAEQTSGSSWIARVEALVLQAIDEGWTLATVASRVGLSERQLRNRFEAETGVSIRHYRANYQLHRALALMRDSRLSLAQIAERVGFNSSAAFTRFIRRETGHPPMALRRGKALQGTS